MRNKLRIWICSIIWGTSVWLAPGQTPTPQAGGESRPMTREERIRANQERIRKLIEESRARQQQSQQGAPAPGAATPGPGQPGNRQVLPGGQVQAPTVLPGQPLPTGPVQQVRPTQPGQQQQKQQAAAVPQGARSESRTILLFNPLDSAVGVGETFKTDVVADTKQGQIDEFSVLIKYPSRLLNPLAVDHRKIEPDVAKGIDYEFDPEEGTIFLRADLKKARAFSQQPLFTVIWEALEPTEGAVISYVFGKDKSSGLYLDGTNLLGTLPGSEDGVINTTVLIRSATRKPTITQVGEKDILISTEPLATPVPRAPMQFKLVTNKSFVRAGEEIEVRLVLENPDAGPMDRLSAYIQWDPKELEAVDSDVGNVIKRGINMNDGKVREEFPFDFYRVNDMQNEKGVAIYEVSATGNKVRGSGTVATMRFKAKREVPQTSVVLVKNVEGEEPTTEVEFRYKDRLANSGAVAEPTGLASVSITVEGQAATLAAEARRD